MLLNVGIDSCIGAIPLLGDVCDFGFKANKRNMAIFEDHVKRGGTGRIQIEPGLLWQLSSSWDPASSVLF